MGSIQSLDGYLPPIVARIRVGMWPRTGLEIGPPVATPLSFSPKSMMALQQDFQSELALLEKLFGSDRVARSMDRLNEIHTFAARRWREYVELIPDGVIRYLLIAEAPPWTAAGAPWFVLDPDSPSRTLMQTLRKTFLNDAQSTQLTTAEALMEFARRGFLIIDSIPFSMKYSSRQRRSQHYRNLVAIAVKTYLLRQITGLSWSTDVRVAFAFKLNAMAIIEALEGQLTLGNTKRPLGEQLIAASQSGFPNADILKKIYALG